MGEKVQGIRSINGRYKNRQGYVKNSIGNGDAQEVICMTHGHELRWGELQEGRWVPGGGGEREKTWDNCNSIINKIYF